MCTESEKYPLIQIRFGAMNDLKLKLLGLKSVSPFCQRLLGLTTCQEQAQTFFEVLRFCFELVVERCDVTRAQNMAQMSIHGLHQFRALYRI
jgi:hypothetical protein